jgi:hypothetical protein
MRVRSVEEHMQRHGLPRKLSTTSMSAPVTLVWTFPLRQQAWLSACSTRIALFPLGGGSRFRLGRSERPARQPSISVRLGGAFPPLAGFAGGRPDGGVAGAGDADHAGDV